MNSNWPPHLNHSLRNSFRMTRKVINASVQDCPCYYLLNLEKVWALLLKFISKCQSVVRKKVYFVLGGFCLICNVEKIQKIKIRKTFCPDWRMNANYVSCGCNSERYTVGFFLSLYNVINFQAKSIIYFILFCLVSSLPYKRRIEIF